MQIIAIHGYAGTGKDTSADILVDNLGFIKTSFATNLYRQVAIAFDVTVDFLGNRKTKETELNQLALKYCKDEVFVALMFKNNASGLSYSDFINQARSPRWIMQQWGTEYRRVASGNPNYWINDIEKFIATSRLNEKILGIVIPDLRLITEYDFIRKIGGQVWHLNRAGILPVNAHTTEVKLPVNHGDLVIENNEGAVELKKMILNYAIAQQSNERKKIFSPKI